MRWGYMNEFAMLIVPVSYYCADITWGDENWLFYQLSVAAQTAKESMEGSTGSRCLSLCATMNTDFGIAWSTVADNFTK